jgi:dTDP-4-amino-4,6-dideoxygalactose transaminase
VEKLPVLRARLPTAELLIPYLRRIDATRIYSNWGPLATELEARLATRLAQEDGSVVLAASGTSALVGGILARAGRATAERPLAIMPAYTFVATATAAELCGYRPFLADIDPVHWMLDAARLSEHRDLSKVGVVIPVAPFGRPVAQEPWRDFASKTGIPVVIDGAASFEGVAENPGAFLGEIPVAISFHATKSFATGEGGCLVTSDTTLAQLIGQSLNFGFHKSRDTSYPNINGKMSEYHAAVGLAELDNWPEKRAAFRAVANNYRLAADARGLSGRVVGAPDLAGCYVLLRCDDIAEAADVKAALGEAGIDYRLWYGTGLHSQTRYAGAARDDLSVTDAVAPLVLGLPVAVDLAEADVCRVVDAIASI